LDRRRAAGPSNGGGWRIMLGMAAPTASAFDLVLRRMYRREGVGTLSAHLEQTYGITVAKMSQLDVGVFRIDQDERNTPLVARLFSAARRSEAAEADLAALRYLAEVGFPAERPFGDHSLSNHEGQAVLVTRFVNQVPRAKRPPHPIVTLGAMVGRLHCLAVPSGADRPSGALHHFVEGTMADELRAAAGWLDSIKGRMTTDTAGEFESLRAAIAAADGGDGLPEGFVHPDPVPKNAIFTVDGPVLVDWTSAGRGPRLASLTLVLASGWAAAPFLKGYTKVVDLTNEERERLPGLLLSRQLIGLAFRVCRQPETMAAAAKKLAVLQRQTRAQAQDLLR